jgi:hypothetical protein
MGDATRRDADRRRACDDIVFSSGVLSAPPDEMRWRSARGMEEEEEEEEERGGRRERAGEVMADGFFGTKNC